MSVTPLIIIVGELPKVEFHCCVTDTFDYNCWRTAEIGVSLLCH